MKKSKKRGKLPIIIVGVLIVGLGAVLWFTGVIPGLLGNKSATSKTKTASAANLVSQVRKITNNPTVEISGNIQPLKNRSLGFPSGGTIASLSVAEGDRVTSGQVLAVQDSLSEMYAYKQQLYTIEQQQYSSSPRELELLNLQLQLKKKALDDRTLTAPFAGIVSSVAVEVGDSVSSGKEVLTLMDRSSMVATVEIDELDIPLVRKGQKVNITFEPIPDKTFTGIVSKVPAQARITNQGIAVLDVEIMIPDPPASIVPAYSFVGSIEVGNGPEEILVVDKGAVFTRGSRSMVLVVPRGTDPATYLDSPLAMMASAASGSRASTGNTGFGGSFPGGGNSGGGAVPGTRTQRNTETPGSAAGTPPADGAAPQRQSAFADMVEVKTEAYSDTQVRILSGVDEGAELLNFTQLAAQAAAATATGGLNIRLPGVGGGAAPTGGNFGGNFGGGGGR